MLRLSKLEPSSNPRTAKKTVDGREFSLMKDGRLFLIAFLVDMLAPFSTFKRRLVSQGFNSLGEPVWNVDLGAFFVGMQINGHIVERQVYPYTIKSIDPRTKEPIERTVTKYSAAVLGYIDPITKEWNGEHVEDVFHNNGHRLLLSKDEVTGQLVYESIDVLPPRFRVAGATPLTPDEEQIAAELEAEHIAELTEPISS